MDDPLRLPSFFKILLDPTRPHLPLPPDFVRKHLKNKKIPAENQIVVQSVSEVGFSWRMKITKVDEIYSFTDGWNNVVEETGLVFGDFLVFWLVDPSTFKLLIFGTNGCEKRFPYSKIKLEHEEQHDGGHGGDDADDEKEVEEKEEEQEDSEEEEEGDKNEEDPSFVKIIPKTNNHYLRFPTKFTRLTGLEKERMIKMKNLINGMELSMSLRSDSIRHKNKSYKRYFLSGGGWNEFRKVNQLCEGDECLIKFIRSQDKLCLSRVIKKTPPDIIHQPVDHVPATKVLKRTPGRPPREDE